jgi:4-amino-4-deoxy-L-arabinose transferase-like glycosyltransferase
MANLATQAPRFSQSFFSDPPAHFRSWALAVVLLAATIFLLRLGDRSFWGSESRWGEITREMQLTGNYFWPTINGEVYYDKPLLSYWLIAATAYLTGDLNELTVRLPSALAGLLDVALLMVLTRQIYDDRTAVLAGAFSRRLTVMFFGRGSRLPISRTSPGCWPRSHSIPATRSDPQGGGLSVCG